MNLLIKNREELAYTSLLFITNYLNARFNGYLNYSTWFYLLTISSILFHGFYPDSVLMNIIDKIPILGIVYNGGYLFYTKLNNNNTYKNIILQLLVSGSFFFVLIIFYYGFLSNQFCFDSDEKIANTYHALIHIASSIGHNIIIIM
jgi:hypothetical protein